MGKLHFLKDFGRGDIKKGLFLAHGQDGQDIHYLGQLCTRLAKMARFGCVLLDWLFGRHFVELLRTARGEASYVLCYRVGGFFLFLFLGIYYR